MPLRIRFPGSFWLTVLLLVGACSRAQVARLPAAPLPPFGLGALRPGGGVSNPVPIRKPSPAYTADAMRFRIQGSVDLEAIVLADGTVGDVRIVKSLDRTFGMDQEAIKAAKKWTFEPARDRNGTAVPVIVIIGFDLRLRDSPATNSSPGAPIAPGP